MSGEMEVGKCEVCGKEEIPLKRTYFRYNIPGIKCSCHSPEHFILICHCNSCEPKEPEYTNIEFRTADLKRLILENSIVKIPTELNHDTKRFNGFVVESDGRQAINPLITAHIPDATISVTKAMEVLTKSLIVDKSEGSYYYGWQSNIACAIMDNSDVDHETANVIAKKFLDQLCAK